MLAGLPLAEGEIVVADVGDLTTKASTIGLAILGAAVVIALIVAFFSQAQRRWLSVLTILAIGAFTAFIVSDPTTALTELGDAIKRAVWDPILETL